MLWTKARYLPYSLGHSLRGDDRSALSARSRVCHSGAAPQLPVTYGTARLPAKDVADDRERATADDAATLYERHGFGSQQPAHCPVDESLHTGRLQAVPTRQLSSGPRPLLADTVVAPHQLTLQLREVVEISGRQRAERLGSGTSALPARSSDLLRFTLTHDVRGGWG